ncbi:MAG: VWA domain-containing protein [Acidobacteria bacterium]|nr:VWA domain-containing protein [Acidobacteriota bacterium]
MKKFVVFLVIIAASLGAYAWAQQPDQSRISLDVSRVNVLFTVSDKRGRFVTNLTKDDFEVFENKKKQNIIEFSSESDLPLRLGLLLDTSNSVRDRFKFEQEAAIEFLNSLLRPRQDRALVYSFDTEAEMISDLTDDHEKLVRAVRGLRPGGGTALYDAIYKSCRDRLIQDQPKHKFRRAIVILSDGEDNQSRVTREQALEMAQKSDVVIYSVSTNITRIQTDGDKLLRYLAVETGGLALFPFKVEDLAQSFENISNELRSQYSILYRPEPLHTDGLFHRIDIKVHDRKDMVVRARKGYFAPKI